MAHHVDLYERVVSELARQQFSTTSRIGVAVSGGVDSLVLLHVLCRLHRTQPFNVLVALHVNHRLRAVYYQQRDIHRITACLSTSECRLVLRTLPRGLIARWAVTHGISIEMAARDLRYGQFRRIVHDCKLDALLLAHHLNDHAETVIMRLLRGEGIVGLQGIPSYREECWNNTTVRYVRPFHAIPKVDLIHYARRIGLRWSFDHTNRSTRYLRNAVRATLVPAIARLFPHYIYALRTLSQQVGDILHYMRAQSSAQLAWQKCSSQRYRIRRDIFCRAESVLQLHSLYQLVNRTLSHTRVPLRFLQSVRTHIVACATAEGDQHVWTGHGIELYLEGAWLYWRVATLPRAPWHHTAILLEDQEQYKHCLVKILSPIEPSESWPEPRTTDSIPPAAIVIWLRCSVIYGPLLIRIEIVVDSDYEKFRDSSCLIAHYKCIIEDSMGVLVSFSYSAVSQSSLKDATVATRVSQWGSYDPPRSAAYTAHRCFNYSLPHYYSSLYNRETNAAAADE